METVLCYLIKENQYLMLYRNKKENDLNAGKWIGVGGKIEKGETKEQALVREVKEETNLNLHSFSFRGTIYFEDTNYTETMYLYTSNNFDGIIKECNEGILKFINMDDVEKLTLWEGDKIFLNLLKNSSNYFELLLHYENNTLISFKRLV